MFTGLVEETGTFCSMTQNSTVCYLEIAANCVLSGTNVGDSIAVNGVCLTVTHFTSATFTADVMPETLRRTNLGSLTRGAVVNLERAMPADGRFGGHIVSGHIDGTGTIRNIRPEGNAFLLRIAASSTLLRYVVEKGSIAVDGISLTVVAVTAHDFTVSLIPHTLASTTLTNARVGTLVNLETDILAKYTERLLHPSDTFEDTLRDAGFRV